MNFFINSPSIILKNYHKYVKLINTNLYYKILIMRKNVRHFLPILNLHYTIGFLTKYIQYKNQLNR